MLFARGLSHVICCSFWPTGYRSSVGVTTVHGCPVQCFRSIVFFVDNPPACPQTQQEALVTVERWCKCAVEEGDDMQGVFCMRQIGERARVELLRKMRIVFFGMRVGR